MTESSEARTRPAPLVAGFHAVGLGGFVVAAILLGERPDPLAAQIAGLLASLVVLTGALRDPRPRLARTAMRVAAGALAATFVVLAVLTR